MRNGETEALVADWSPLNRIGQLGDIADVTVFLAAVTGQCAPPLAGRCV
ncbi:hypothetical protein ACW2Q0_09385 [Nocardia sp. R16R-3T]